VRCIHLRARVDHFDIDRLLAPNRWAAPVAALAQ
jgi:hypothetical protein